MSRTPIPVAPAPPPLEEALYSLNVDELKWYAAALPGKVPTRKAEVVAMISSALTNPSFLRQAWSRLTEGQGQVISEVVYNLKGVYDPQVIEAKYSQVRQPTKPQQYYSYQFGAAKKITAAEFDLFFFYNSQFGCFIPSDLAALLRTFIPSPPAETMRSQAEPLAAQPDARYDEFTAETIVTDTERAVFHDLEATLNLIKQGKVSVSATTRLPTLGTLRQLRKNLIIGDYFEDAEYERAEDAVRPLALIMLVQAAKWAAPMGTSGAKLALTKSGEALLAGILGAQHVREAWERWVKSDLLDELSRIRSIRGQQSKDARLTKPAERRAKLDTALRACPIGRWVEFDEFLRYIRSENLLPVIERNEPSALYIGSYFEYGWLGYSGLKYWDVVAGSYLRAVVWEYAATLGLVEIAYTRPEDTPHDFGDVYGMDELDYLSRYDGLLGFRLTDLGAYALGLVDSYTPPAPAAKQGPPVLKVLPTLDVVITDASRVLPNERMFLERIGTPQSQDVYRLNRDLLLDAAQEGLSLGQAREFLTLNSGIPEAEFPQTVRVFFSDLEKRLNALRDGGRMLVLESDDPYTLTELSYAKSLRDMVQLGKIGERTVLLVPEDQEREVRKQLKKLGYVPRK